MESAGHFARSKIQSLLLQISHVPQLISQIAAKGLFCSSTGHMVSYDVSLVELFMGHTMIIMLGQRLGQWSYKSSKDAGGSPNHDTTLLAYLPWDVHPAAENPYVGILEAKWGKDADVGEFAQMTADAVVQQEQGFRPLSQNSSR